jgi:hypothetical protein
MVVFGVPRLHEDDAERAVRAALAMRDAVADLNRNREFALALRIGVNSGEVVTGDGAERQFLVTGDAVNVAARLQAGAEPAEVVVGALTERLTRAAIEYEAREPITAKGKAEPVLAFRALRARSALRLPTGTLALHCSVSPESAALHPRKLGGASSRRTRFPGLEGPASGTRPPGRCWQRGSQPPILSRSRADPRHTAR